MEEFPFKSICTSLLIWIAWTVVRGGSITCLIGPVPVTLKPLLLVAVMPVLFAFGLGSDWIFGYYPPAGMGASDADVFQMHDRGAWYALLVYGGAALLGPVTEELVFGGVLVNRLSHKWGLPAAVLVSSILFALPHPHVASGLIFGLTMAVIYVATQSLLLPIVIHVMNNAVAVWAGGYEAETGTNVFPAGTACCPHLC